MYEVPGPWSHVPLSQSGQREDGKGMLVLGTEIQSEGAGAPSPTPSGDHGTFTSLTPPPQVRERDLPFVTHTLSSEFTILRVVNGETVAAENLGITNGFVKPKLGELREEGCAEKLQEMTRCCPRAPPFSEPRLKARHHMVQQSSDPGSPKGDRCGHSQKWPGATPDPARRINVGLPEAVTLRLKNLQHK